MDGYPSGFRRSVDDSSANQALCGSTVEDFLRNVETDASSLTVPIFDTAEACGYVSVEHPQTESDSTGMKKFTTYEVRGTLQGTEFSSRKRYSDFEWFRKALLRQLPGVFLPALPGKQSVGRFDKEFIEERRARLQQFLLRIFRRPEICSALPLVRQFLTGLQQNFDQLKSEADERTTEELLKDYRAVFAETLECNSAPKSDKGFQMVKAFLDRHTPALKVAHEATLSLLKHQAELASRQHAVGLALQELQEDENELLEKAQASSSSIRSDVLTKFASSMEIEKRGRDIHTLNASLQREIEDCGSAQECLSSIEFLQQKVLATKSKIQQDSNSLASLRGEAAPPPEDAASPTGAADALAQSMRKRDKTKEFFGKMSSAVMDVGAKIGVNTDKRVSALLSMIEQDKHEVETLESLIDAARTVFSATEITAFLETKVAGCLWAQRCVADKKSAICQELAACWGVSN